MNKHIFLMLCLLAAFPGAALAAAGGAPPLVLVLDASGSMWGQVGGEAKIVGARRVVGELARGLADGTELALVAYGHRREADCADVETVLPPAPLDRGRLGQAIAAINPKGKTPITAALEHAFGVAPAGATIVLVSDGLETCGGDPCAAVRKAKSRQLDFLLHVVGLDVEKEDTSQLACAAAEGGGLYFPAKDASELAAALAVATAEPAAVPAGALVVGATRNGALQDVAIEVVPLGGSGARLTARTYARSESNPRTIPLADGRYRVRVNAVGIDGAPDRIDEITIAGGAKVERRHDYSTGELRIGATRNGALSDVLYQVFAPGDRKKAVATGRTYRTATSNPASARLVSGEYEVVLKALEIAGEPQHTLAKVVVEPSGRVQVTHDFRSGDLLVGAVRGTALVDALVVVRAGGKSIDQSRTYTSATSNPKRFTLPPGDYEVEVAEIGGAKRSVKISVAAGGTAERIVDLGGG